MKLTYVCSMDKGNQVVLIRIASKFCMCHSERYMKLFLSYEIIFQSKLVSIISSELGHGLFYVTICREKNLRIARSVSVELKNSSVCIVLERRWISLIHWIEINQNLRGISWIMSLLETARGLITAGVNYESRIRDYFKLHNAYWILM